MSAFDVLQEQKVEHAKRLHKLLNEISGLRLQQIHGYDFESFIKRFVENLPIQLNFLIKKVDEQMKIEACVHESQCTTLLKQEEFELLKLYNYAVHFKQTGKYADFDEAAAAKVLREVILPRDKAFFDHIRRAA